MKIIHSDNTKRVIKDKFSYDFEIPQDGLYLVEITASAKNWRQNWKKLFQHDDLAVSTNNINFPRKDGEIFHAPTGWNGNNLKGLSKTNVILINLLLGKHKINFLSRREPVVENIKIIQIDSPQFTYTPRTNNPPTDGDRRQWITISSTGVAIKEAIISASCKKYKNNREDDDIKLIIDEQIVNNDAKNSHRDWFWCGKILQGNTKEFKQQLNFDTTKHYIELYADRTPKMQSINFTTTPTTAKTKGVIVWKETILRKEPNQNSEALVENIKQDATVSIIEKAIAGIRPTNSSGQPLNSDRWHKARFGNMIGYIYCEAIEIEGESESEIKTIIIEKSQELGESGCLMFAIAKRESRLFPYATSAMGAQGIFQLLQAPITDVNTIYNKDFANRFNIKENIEAGILYFKNLREKYNNSNNAIEKTLAAWNWGQNHIDKNSAFNYDAVPSETQIFIKDVLKTKADCELAPIKISTILFCLIIATLLIFSTTSLPQASAATLTLPENYADYSIEREIPIDVNNDGIKENIIVISDITTNGSFGQTKTLLLRTDGTIAVISSDGSELRQIKIDDFNNDGEIEIATFYGYTGSAGFGTFFLHRYNNTQKRFQLLITRNDVENNVNLVDMDSDGIEEIIYNFHIFKWGINQRQIYKWNKELSKYVAK